MIRVAFAKVKPDKVERLESWLLGAEDQLALAWSGLAGDRSA